ncbi:dipeptide/oligopeptide/nickel ABC transporter ATP-binding protein [Spirochaetia bacterium]|nr:dipeptide/oligopeptide/nickel ABC transporter ATP-binding protein [Spirochaetia bacterium]GHV89962.1 dipeptide/oligopeptide/nickel ABC transporter ATP-binding protein [Spirochaetia bacterium]
MAPMLEVKNLTTFYKTRMNEKICSVDNVSFVLEDGKSLGIAGESGCGKSTLALSVMGYYFPPLYYEAGTIVIDGQEITRLAPDTIRKTVLGTEIAYIPQAAMNALNPTRKIIRFIEDVLKAHDSTMSKKEIRSLAEERFSILNLPPKVLDQYAVELSGGMKQRTVIAISTILSPKVLIADEPSSALDVSSQKIVIKLLHDLMEKGFVRSMLFITHELPLLYNVTDDIMVMYAGEIVERGTAHEMVFDPIMPYSKGLMNSIIVPEEGTRGHVLQAIPGVPPNLKIRPQGCRFSERCRYAEEPCRTLSVQELSASAGRSYRCRHKLDDLYKIYEEELPRLLDEDTKLPSEGVK